MTGHDKAHPWDRLFRLTRFAGLSAAAFGVFSLFWGYHGVAAIADSRPLYAMFYLPAALACSLEATRVVTIAIRRTRSGAPPKVTAHRPGGTAIRMSPEFRVGYIVFLALTLVSATVFAVGFWTDQLTFPMSDGQLIVFPYVAAGLAVFAAAALVYFACGWLRFSEIFCTPDKLVMKSFKVRDEIAWSDIEAIEPTASGNSMAILVEPVDGAKVTVEVFYRGPFAPSPEDPIVCVVDLFPTGPEALLDFLRYYLDHPEAREELGDGRAVERLQQ
ncbi:hypothetical protein R4144_11870 [Gordonia amicalis]|uniref:hypothetical protein n=1 Tax=Gordonia amicalis TaxID=89053 RepID=UPI002682D1D0|nr:hypothetical protein [Gordonia amicalis]MDV7174061.1 hypothetical protein [Gordonia amicalis]